MSLFAAVPTMRLTLRALAYLLRYPDSQWRIHLAALSEVLHSEAALPVSRLAELDALIAYMTDLPVLRLEADYVELFDRGRGTALHLFEHVHGDSRDRGPAMIDLLKTYEQARLYLAPGEFPDHLPVVLEFASTQPPAQAREFLAETAHIVRAIFSAVRKRQSPYASVLAAVLELAGEKAELVTVAAEPALDDTWAEPDVFGGCTTEGQAKPGQSQHVQFIHTTAASGVLP